MKNEMKRKEFWKEKRKVIERVIITSDHHCNHDFGLSRPGKFPCRHNDERVAAWRQWEWERWEDFCNKANEEKITEIIYNGDCTDGFSEKTAGIGSWSPDKEDWKDAFQDIHFTLTKKRPVEKIVVTMGTGYHGGIQRGLNMDKEIAGKINAEYHPTYDLEIGGFLFKIQHQAGGVSLINPESTLQRELRAEERFFREIYKMLLEQHQEGLLGGYDGLFLGHVHQYVKIEKPGWIGVISPCWQGLTEYMIRKSAFLQPHIGGIIIDLFEGWQEPWIQKVIYPIPPHLWSTLNHEEIQRIEERRRMSDFDRTEIIAYQNSLKKSDPGKEVKYKPQNIHKGVAKQKFKKPKEEKFKVQRVHQKSKMKGEK